jgi:hypothetical protein
MVMSDHLEKRVHLVNLVLMEDVDYLDNQENLEKKECLVFLEDLD